MPDTVQIGSLLSGVWMSSPSRGVATQWGRERNAYFRGGPHDKSTAFADPTDEIEIVNNEHTSTYRRTSESINWDGHIGLAVLEFVDLAPTKLP